jgi:hypothetical protein
MLDAQMESSCALRCKQMIQRRSVLLPVMWFNSQRVFGVFWQLPSYALLSRQALPNEKPVDEIVLVPSISRALILSGT